MSALKKNRHVWIIPVYGVLYLIAFIFLERSQVKIHMIHSRWDDYIPFCEYFIVPYLLWFAFVAAALVYFAFINIDRKEYYQLVGVLGTGMTAFVIISFVFPNGHALRPVLTEGNLFVKAVIILYRLDTPTNILPSLHVFNALACCGAITKNRECKKHRIKMIIVWVLTVLIILSTVFLKQHSVLDVILAVLLYAVCYYAFYEIIPKYEEPLAHLLTKKEIMTIPNFLSVFRLILAVLFLGIHQRYGGMAGNKELLTAILILSGITDFLDGKIARKFHMVSEVGKILDPIADKVTQGVLLLCLFSEYNMAKGVFALFLTKEGYMAVMGARAVMRMKKNEDSKWYGKINTTVFYIVMIVLIFFRDISESTANFMILCCGGFMLLAFIMYARYYRILQKNGAERQREQRTSGKGAECHAEYGKKIFGKDETA